MCENKRPRRVGDIGTRLLGTTMLHNVKALGNLYSCYCLMLCMADIDEIRLQPNPLIYINGLGLQSQCEKLIQVRGQVSPLKLGQANTGILFRWTSKSSEL